MRETSLGTTAEIAQKSHIELLGLVRGACEMLLSTQPYVVESTEVSRMLEDRQSARFIRRMTLGLAQEYGLYAEVTLTGFSFVVRLGRPPANPLESVRRPAESHGD